MTMSPFIGIAGFLFAISTYFGISKQPAGNAKMTGIAALIESGSMTFLKKEYTILIVFLAFVTALLGFRLGSAQPLPTLLELLPLWDAAS